MHYHKCFNVDAPLNDIIEHACTNTCWHYLLNLVALCRLDESAISLVKRTLATRTDIYFHTFYLTDYRIHQLIVRSQTQSEP